MAKEQDQVLRTATTTAWPGDAREGPVKHSGSRGNKHQIRALG